VYVDPSESETDLKARVDAELADADGVLLCG
jgi:hypothetical protein